MDSISSMVRGTLAGTAGVFLPRWKRVAPVSALVPRSAPGALTLPLPPFPLPSGERKGERSVAGAKACWYPPHAMVARVQYVPNEKSRFLVTLYLVPMSHAWFRCATSSATTAGKGENVENFWTSSSVIDAFHMAEYNRRTISPCKTNTNC